MDADRLTTRTDAPTTHADVLSGGTHLVMFWLLVGMALFVAIPCVLVPVWMDTQELIQAERQAAETVARLTAYEAEQQRIVTALTEDPLVIERLARRDLRYRQPDEELWPVGADLPPELVTTGPKASDAVPPPVVEPPAIVERVAAWLPGLPWVDLFGRASNRAILLLMAGGLLAAAFLLFGTSRTNHCYESTDRE